jgi:hypothetical protein
MVATDAFVANYMFLLVKNRSSVGPRIHWRQIVKHAAARQLMPPSQQAIGVVLLTRLILEGGCQPESTSIEYEFEDPVLEALVDR